VVAVTLAVAAVLVALLVEALARRQPSTVAAFGQHRLSVVAAHTLPAEVLADQVPLLDSIMAVIAWLPCGRRASLVQSVGTQRHMSAVPARLFGNQTA
jgi:hypothetical protein